MKYLTVILSLSVLLFFAVDCQAQYENYLILKRGYKSVHHYLSGDSIRILRNHHETPTIGILEAIGEDFIVIRGEVFPLKEIRTLYHYRKSFNFQAGGSVLQIAGPAFLAMVAFNALINSIKPIWSTRNLITAGSITGLGLLLPQFQVRKYELGKKFKLRIVPSDAALHQIKGGT